MSEGLLDAVILEPAGAVTATLVLLHGLGADGHDLAPLVPLLGLPDGVRVVLPHAPVRPVTINGGFAMRAWYDMFAIAPRRSIDEAQMHGSVAAVFALLRAEAAAGVPSERVVLAGFSQGGAVALLAGLGYERSLAGIVVLSSYRPEMASPVAPDPANAATPVWHAHGLQDDVVPVGLGRAAYESVRGGGNPVVWHDYPMGHELCAEQCDDLGRWLRARFAAPQGGEHG